MFLLTPRQSKKYRIRSPWALSLSKSRRVLDLMHFDKLSTND